MLGNFTRVEVQKLVLKHFYVWCIDLGIKLGPRLREVTPAEKGSLEAVLTQT